MPKYFYTNANWANWDTVTKAEVIRPIIQVVVYKPNDFTIPASTHDYQGEEDKSGEIVNISFPRQNITRERTSFAITWAGNINSELLALFLATKHTAGFNGKTPRAALYLYIDGALFPYPYVFLAVGQLDQCYVQNTADNWTFTTEFWNGPDAMWDTPRPGRYTPDFQKRIFSVNEDPLGQSFAADKGFDFVSLLQDWTLFWGKGKGSGGQGGGKQKGKNKEKRG